MKKLLYQKKWFGKEKFDIFGGLIDSKEKIQKLSNKKHREIKKDKFSIVKLSEIKDEKDYLKIIEKVIRDIENSLEKVKTSIEISIYKLSKEKNISNNDLDIFNLNPKDIIDDLKILKDENELNLYKINLKENTPIIGLTNIIYYDNTNKTLPVGMDLTSQVLIKKSLLEINLITKIDFNILIEDEQDVLSLPKFKKINVIEYEANYKTTKHIKYIKSTNLKKV